MSRFIAEIYESVFQPGTNRSVVLATHMSFAALQATFVALLLATRSWHFVFLNAICGGLWAAVAWLINEVAKADLVEAEAQRLRELRKASEAGESVENKEQAEEKKEL